MKKRKMIFCVLYFLLLPLMVAALNNLPFKLLNLNVGHCILYVLGYAYVFNFLTDEILDGEPLL